MYATNNLPSVGLREIKLCMTSHHRWASTLISMSAISDIRHRHLYLLFRYWRQICRLKNSILIPEVFRYRHQSSFRYPTLKKINISPCRFEPVPLWTISGHYYTKLPLLTIEGWMSDIPYRIKLSDIRYNVWLRSLSPILEVPISGSVWYRWSRISD